MRLLSLNCTIEISLLRHLSACSLNLFDAGFSLSPEKLASERICFNQGKDQSLISDGSEIPCLERIKSRCSCLPRGTTLLTVMVAPTSRESSKSTITTDYVLSMLFSLLPCKQARGSRDCSRTTIYQICTPPNAEDVHRNGCYPVVIMLLHLDVV
jgi:hypothetical protein